MRPRIVTVWLPLLWLVAQPASPQATISALARELEPVAESSDVICTRFASFEGEPSITVGMVLEPGDLLASVSGEIDLELTCGGGTLLRFSGAFRVLIDAPEAGNDCAVNFLSGTLDVLTDQETEVNAGGVVLGTEGTQYSVELIRGTGGVDQRCSVWDGKVVWRARKEKEERWLGGGQRLAVAGGRFTEGEVAAAERSAVARRAARFDVVKSRQKGRKIEDPATEVERLSKLHREVLERPEDTDRRVELARAQIDLEAGDQAMYHLARAGISSTEQMAQHRIDASKLPASRVASTPDPFRLMEARRWRDALEIFQQRLKSGTTDSRDYCGTARCYFHLEGRGSYNVSSYANRSIALHARDHRLSEEELEFCGRLIRRR